MRRILVGVKRVIDFNVRVRVRPDGTGDVTRTHVAWTLRRSAPHTPSPLAVGDELYVVNDMGIGTCLDGRTGETLWEHTYPSRQEDFSFGAGPHATPLVVGDRVFSAGTNQQLFAFDKRSGRVLYSVDLPPQA